MVTKNLSLQHLIRPAVRSEKAPTIIMLHGYGSNEQDLFSFAPELAEKYLIVSAKAPLEMMPYGNAWYEINFDAEQNKFTNDKQAVASRELVKTFIEEVIEHYNADPTNICLLGFSQGAILSYATALSYPKLVQRVAALSGYIHEPIFKSGYEKNDFSQLRIFASHGSSDQVIPVTWARKNKGFLDQLDIKNTYNEYPVGHGVSPQNFNDLKNWLAQENP